MDIRPYNRLCCQSQIVLMICGVYAGKYHPPLGPRTISTGLGTSKPLLRAICQAFIFPGILVVLVWNEAMFDGVAILKSCGIHISFPT